MLISIIWGLAIITLVMSYSEHEAHYVDIPNAVTIACANSVTYKAAINRTN